MIGEDKVLDQWLLGIKCLPLRVVGVEGWGFLTAIASCLLSCQTVSIKAAESESDARRGSALGGQGQDARTGQGA